ncbi:MAG: hypothetical protein IPM79_38150 [Polyangiaceae bacterium]|jgi:hypothetical protein|nr:hypothetical protein [Polyangiaceae bacterium]MBK8943271.1 hypothetical protein [Polyangiaceae bacterium]
MRLLLSKLVAALGLAAALAGCASQFDGSVYRGDGFAFRVSPAPAAWRPMAATGAALAYADTASGGQILVNARCDRDAEDTPLRSLTQHLFIRFTERVTHSESVVPFDGREAMRTDITAKLDGVNRRFLVWVMKKDRCVYDLLYFSSPERFESGAPAFEGWTRDFRALPREVSP